MDPKKMHLLANRILVKRDAALKTKSGIILPDSAQQKQKQGQVVAVGPGKRDDEGELQSMSIQIGDTVVFGAYAGSEVKADEAGIEYLIMTEDEVLGILN